MCPFALKLWHWSQVFYLHDICLALRAQRFRGVQPARVRQHLLNDPTCDVIVRTHPSLRLRDSLKTLKILSLNFSQMPAKNISLLLLFFNLTSQSSPWYVWKLLQVESDEIRKQSKKAFQIAQRCQVMTFNE